jgi:hypothetical protein
MKDNAIILDENLLIEQNLSIDEFLTILALDEKLNYQPKLELLEVLQEKQFLKIIKNETDEKIILREKSKLLIELVNIDRVCSTNKKVIKKSDRLVKEEVNSFIREFRLKWKGLKSGSMGDPKACYEKMCRWMRENPEYTKDQIMKAADIYINTIDSLKYLQRADYFIYKKEGTDEHSRLSAFIDEEEILENWTTELK